MLPIQRMDVLMLPRLVLWADLDGLCDLRCDSALPPSVRVGNWVLQNRDFCNSSLLVLIFALVESKLL